MSDKRSQAAAFGRRWERRVARAVSPGGGRPGDTVIGLELGRSPKRLPVRPEPTG
jgi:hypothetical protein